MEAEPRNPKSASELVSDKELARRGKYHDFVRKQQLLDASNLIGRLGIYVAPTLVLLWLVIVSIHFIATKNWTAFESLGKQVAMVVIGYFIAYLQQSGIKGK